MIRCLFMLYCAVALLAPPFASAAVQFEAPPPAHISAEMPCADELPLPGHAPDCTRGCDSRQTTDSSSQLWAPAPVRGELQPPASAAWPLPPQPRSVAASIRLASPLLARAPPRPADSPVSLQVRLLN